MGTECRPVGAALPPRRDAARVEAADAAPTRLDGGADSIIVPAARDRMLELIEREQLPGDVRQTLAGALGGDLRRQQLLFQAMIDTWPRLQKAIREVKLAARKAPWRVAAWAPRGPKAAVRSGGAGARRGGRHLVDAARPETGGERIRWHHRGAGDGLLHRPPRAGSELEQRPGRRVASAIHQTGAAAFLQLSLRRTGRRPPDAGPHRRHGRAHRAGGFSGAPFPRGGERRAQRAPGHRRAAAVAHRILAGGGLWVEVAAAVRPDLRGAHPLDRNQRTPRKPRAGLPPTRAGSCSTAA